MAAQEPQPNDPSQQNFGAPFFPLASFPGMAAQEQETPVPSDFTGWGYEGIQCYVRTDPADGFVPIFRAWNPGKDHIYTQDRSEYDNFPATWKEGVAFFVASTNLGGTMVPLLRLHNSGITDHFYTTNTRERDHAINHLGYSPEKQLGFVRSAPAGGFAPLYRAFHPVISDHFYTTSVAEIDRNGPSHTSQAIEATIRAQLGPRLRTDCCFHMADGRYFLPTVAVAQEIINASNIRQGTWTPEVFDCDDFAWLQKGAFIKDAFESGRRTLPYAVAMVWGTTPRGGHAVNLIVCCNGDGHPSVRFLEPQKGVISTVDENTRDPKNKLSNIWLVIM